MNKKILSIAIPAYKRYDFLVKLLSQIDDQIVNANLEGEIEVLICDDSGKDKNNFESLAPFLSREYLRYIDNGSNIGIINNILKIIEESSGKYCLALGDDEELLEAKLAECVADLRKVPETVVAVIFDEQAIRDDMILSCEGAAEKYFWSFGNLGQFAINTRAVKKYFSKNQRNTVWPQTELVFNAAIEENYMFLIKKNLVAHSPNHRDNTRYNSFYFLNVAYLSSIKTALNLSDIEIQYFAVKNINNQKQNKLKNLLMHYVFNDTKNDTKNTVILLQECRKFYNQHVDEKSIYWFAFLSKIPKYVFIVVLKILRKYDKLEKGAKNIDDGRIKINDKYTG